MKTRKIQMHKMVLEGEIRAESFDKEKGTVTVVASTGSRVKRGGFFSDPFFQELEVSKRAIKLARFKNGAPVLDSHGHTKGFFSGGLGIRDVMGVVENPRIEQVKRTGEKESVPALVTEVRFSDREEFQGVIRDIENKIIRNVSIGFNIHRNKELEERVGDTKIFRATLWEPIELSFVPAGADPDSMSRSNNSNDTVECEFQFINNERGTALEPTKENGGSPVKNPAGPETRGTENAIDAEKVRKKADEKAVLAERQRALEIRKAVSAAKMEGKIADEMIARGISADQCRTEVLEKMAKKDETEQTRSTTVEVGADNERIGRSKAMTSAILLRMDPNYKWERKAEANDEMIKLSQPFKFMRLIDLAAETLQARGINTRGMSVMNLASRGLHSTSDFPEILANVVNKTLRRGYLESPATWAPFTTVVEVSDFKEISRTNFGDAPVLTKKLENGEYASGTISEQAEKYSVEEYGKLVPIGRRVLINDDLNAFARLPQKMGRQARNLESDLIYTDLIANPTMADGFALYSADHKNLGTPGALSETTLTEARKLMRLQTGLGSSKLNLTPKLLVTPVALETTADKLLTTITPNTTGDVNIFGPGGKTPLSNLAEPRLDDSSATVHHLFADLGQIDIYEMAMLQGERGPVTDQEIDFNTDGIKFKIRHTVGVKVIDFRGTVKNAGA